MNQISENPKLAEKICVQGGGENRRQRRRRRREELRRARNVLLANIKLSRVSRRSA